VCPKSGTCPDYISCDPTADDPSQFCPSGEQCTASGFCANLGLIQRKVAQAPGFHAGPACDPNSTITQYCPGGEVCPKSGTCPDYISCDPTADDPSQFCPSGEQCTASGFCANLGLIQKKWAQ